MIECLVSALRAMHCYLLVRVLFWCSFFWFFKWDLDIKIQLLNQINKFDFCCRNRVFRIMQVVLGSNFKFINEFLVFKAKLLQVFFLLLDLLDQLILRRKICYVR